MKSKIIVSMRPRDMDNPNLMITYAQDIFLQTFGFPREMLKNFPFDLITGPSTPRENLHFITTAVLAEKSACEFLNLYRSNGVPLSCYVSVVSISNRSEESQITIPAAERTKWAVLTIRSASSVGNSKHMGIGVLGIDRVSQDVLNTIGCVGSKAKAKREASTIELNHIIGKSKISGSSESDSNNYEGEMGETGYETAGEDEYFGGHSMPSRQSDFALREEVEDDEEEDDS